jgi:hypothetical protein
MSFYVLVSPLHTRTASDWIASAAVTYGIPHPAPPERDLPTVKHVLSAIRRANCHGRAWFHVRGPSASTDLPPCPDPATCAEADGLDLGEIALQTDGATSRWSQTTVDELELDTPVVAIQFRNPSGRAVLAAALALAPHAGPLLVFNDFDAVFVVSTDDDPSRMAEHWPMLGLGPARVAD